MRITFKNVGQGDSILLQWVNEKGRLQIGVIDCNKQSSFGNVVLHHIKSLKEFDFKFIILSHPHTDHFSGINELLDYIAAEKIPLRYFLHTCASKEEYLRHSVSSITSKNQLIRIFKFSSELHENGLIEECGFVNNLSRELSLEEGISLKFLYPNESVISKFNRQAFKNTEILENNPDSNLLCTVVKIYSSDWAILLTADAVSDVFWELNRKRIGEFQPNFLLGQVSHHGAEANFHSPFWKSMSKANPPFAVISVGENGYGHPSLEVLKELGSLKYKVRLTSGNPGSVISGLPELDMVSTLVSTSNVPRDLTFEINGSLCEEK